jgi:nicotinamidase-related amidase
MGNDQHILTNLNRLIDACERNNTFSKYEKDIHDLILQLPDKQRVEYLQKMKKYHLLETNTVVPQDHEEITEEISKATKTLKTKTQLIHDALKEDNSLLNRVNDMTDQNLNLVNKGNQKIQKEFQSNLSKLNILIIASLMFVSIYLIIKIFPK